MERTITILLSPSYELRRKRNITTELAFTKVSLSSCIWLMAGSIVILEFIKVPRCPLEIEHWAISASFCTSVGSEPNSCSSMYFQYHWEYHPPPLASLDASTFYHMDAGMC